MVNVTAQVASIHKKVDVDLEKGIKDEKKEDAPQVELTTRQGTILGIKVFLIFAVLHFSLYFGAFMTDFGSIEP